MTFERRKWSYPTLSFKDQLIVKTTREGPFQGCPPWVPYLFDFISDGWGHHSGGIPDLITFSPDFWTDEDLLMFPELKDKTATLWQQGEKWHGKLE